MSDDQFSDASMLYSVRTRRVGGLTTAFIFDREGKPRASVCERGDRATWEVREGAGRRNGRRYKSLSAAIAVVCDELGLTEPNHA